jgi:AcrR family transcriptional regulator
MRITAEAKTETRLNIIRAARKLLARDGWERTTTRRIAQASGIATGTLFNYFESKEAIVEVLVSEALNKAQKEVERRRSSDQSLEEELFSLIWTELGSLREFRKCLPEAAETVFSPLRRLAPDNHEDSIRRKHLEAVAQLIERHGGAVPVPALTKQLYWTLYLGVLAHWVSDESPNQEDSLVLLDQSLKMFTALLERDAERKRSHDSTTQRAHRSASPRRRRSGEGH